MSNVYHVCWAIMSSAGRRSYLNTEQFEEILNTLCARLTADCQATGIYSSSADFETQIRRVLAPLVAAYDLSVDAAPHPHVFPDIVLGKFGIEIKYTKDDKWRSIANSIFESTRDPNVEHVYLIFGKMGGVSEVKWGLYEDCVIHVRTSHVPRFEVQIPSGISNRESIFLEFGISYAEFAQLPIDERMKYVRAYARKKHPGEQLWWLDAKPAEEQWVPTELRLFTALSNDEKDIFRAESALLFPEIIYVGDGGNNARRKYDRLTFYLLKRHSVICSNARDMFSAGSALGEYARTKPTGAAHIPWVLRRLESHIYRAAENLEDALFVEYWGESHDSSDPRQRAERRIARWLAKADLIASGWKPSETLFRATLPDNTGRH